MEYDVFKLKDEIVKKGKLTTSEYLDLLIQHAKKLRERKSEEKPIISIAKSLKIDVSKFLLKKKK